MKKTIYILLTMLSILSCEYKVQLPESAPQLVVEGWIEDGGFPIVMVTTTVPVTESVAEISQLKEHVVNWAKVSVSDGERETVLIGQINDDYFPPYIYTTTSMVGEAGKNYKVSVEYSGRKVTAVTSIPEPKPLEYIKVKQAKDDSGKFYLIGGLEDNPQTKDYYKVFTKTLKKDSTYVSSFMGLTDDEILGEGTDEIIINNGSGKIGEPMNTYFSADDIISVRFATLDRTSWMYWSDFEEIQSLTSSPIFSVTTNIRSNIKGGLGYWAGYGSSFYKVNIPDSLRLGHIH